MANLVTFAITQKLGPLMGLMSLGLVIPIDTVRRNFIAAEGHSLTPWKDYLECSKHLVQNHGYQSLYRGFYWYPGLYLGLYLLSYDRKH